MAAALAGVACGGASVGGDGPPSALVPLSAARQTGLTGALVASAPRVKVVDGAGHPIAGVTVSFAVTAGGGTADPASGVSGDDGIVTTTWRLGTTGEQALQATSPEVAGAAVVFTAAAYDAGAYHIDLQLLTTATDTQWAAFTDAASRIGEIVVGELTPVNLTGRSCNDTALSGSVDDLLILVRLRSIDGRGGILGQAGPCVVRSSGFPAVGIMEFDTADLASLESSGKLRATILHEMLHVVGFGTMWSSSGLLSGAGTASSSFTGPAALEAALGFNGAPGDWTSVPVENCVGVTGTCGAGTRDAHWRESVFRNELMTGWLSGATQPLSRTTAASLADLGYAVDLDAADPFDLSTAALRADASSAAEPDGIYLGDDVLQVPIEIVP
jgi:hypothetical protein